MFMKEDITEMAALLIHTCTTQIIDADILESLIPKEVANSNLLPVGTRVTRGPDWDPDLHGNQDSKGVGTVISQSENGMLFQLNLNMIISMVIN